MKTKKRFNFRKICYLMLVLSVLGGISMSYCFGNELKENNVKKKLQPKTLPKRQKRSG